MGSHEEDDHGEDELNIEGGEQNIEEDDCYADDQQNQGDEQFGEYDDEEED